MDQLEETTSEFFLLLAHLRNYYFRPAEQIARIQLAPAQFHAISVLYRKGPLPMGELAAEMKISKQQLTPLVSRLIEEGMALRKQDQNDRRIVLIQLSEKGRSTFSQLGAKIRNNFQDKLGRLSDSDLNELKQLLHRVRALIESVD